jgi:hypothetical protein
VDASCWLIRRAVDCGCAVQRTRPRRDMLRSFAALLNQEDILPPYGRVCAPVINWTEWERKGLGEADAPCSAPARPSPAA